MFKTRSSLKSALLGVCILAVRPRKAYIRPPDYSMRQLTTACIADARRVRRPAEKLRTEDKEKKALDASGLLVARDCTKRLGMKPSPTGEDCAGVLGIETLECGARRRKRNTKTHPQNTRVGHPIRQENAQVHQIFRAET